MKSWREAIRDCRFSGGLASAATGLAASLYGKWRLQHAAAPLNSVSHVVHGDEAAAHDELSLKYTVPGLALNHAAALFWAAIYEKLFGDEPTLRRALLGGSAVALLAYVIDYHVVPQRLTPGYEKRMEPAGLAAIYSALALSLALSNIVRRARA